MIIPHSSPLAKAPKPPPSSYESMAKKRCAHGDKFSYMQKYFFVYAEIFFRICGNLFLHIRKFPCAYMEVFRHIYRDFIPLIVKRKEGAKEVSFPCTLLCSMSRSRSTYLRLGLAYCRFGKALLPSGVVIAAANIHLFSLISGSVKRPIGSLIRI